jgi:hypothetical protein
MIRLLVREGPHERRLADSGLAAGQNEAAVSRHRRAQMLAQSREVRAALDQLHRSDGMTQRRRRGAPHGATSSMATLSDLRSGASTSSPLSATTEPTTNAPA